MADLVRAFNESIKQPRVRKGLDAQMAALATSRLHHRGWKIALNSPSYQQAEHLGGPLVGHLLGNPLPSRAHVPLPQDHLLLVEVELALILGKSVPVGAASREWLQAIDGVAPALEFLAVPRQRQDIEAILEANSYSAGIVVGEVCPYDFVHPVDLDMTIERNGMHAASLDPSLVVGDPAEIIGFVAEAIGHWGESLLAGQLVLCGSLNPPVRVEVGDRIAAQISAFGSVTAQVCARVA